MNEGQIEQIRKSMAKIESRLHRLKLDFQIIIRDFDRFNKKQENIKLK